MTHAPEPAPQHVLVIDDDPTNCELVEGLLAAEGLAVTSVYDGATGYARLVQDPPDLVLLDVMMPGENGFDVCRRMKAELGHQFVPIILLTALNDVDSLERGFAAGADDFVAKPFDQRVLMARVRSALRAKRFYEELRAVQHKLVDAERLSAVGEMTVTLKHEINNPLQTIIGYADYLLSSIDPSHEFHDQLEAICKSGERISELLGKLDHVRRVETAPYLGDGRMVDLDRSTRTTDDPNSA